MTALQQFNQTFNYHIENPSLEMLSMMMDVAQFWGHHTLAGQLYLEWKN